MRYYRARQRRIDDRWEYTVEDGHLSYPVGYCMGVPDIESESMAEALGGRGSPAYIYFKDIVIRNKGSYHLHGHESKEDACACYRKYILDSRLQLDVRSNKDHAKCQICAADTQYDAVMDTARYSLCDLHRTRSTIEKLMPAVFERWER